MSSVPPGRPVDAVGAAPSVAAESGAALGRRAQILATEHWGLLAARGTAQSEVLTRITIYLTLVSASLVTIGLLGQATGFRDWFAGAALAILGFLTLLGLMTQTRVFNVAEEDLMYVVAMNRLRGAYVDLDPVVERYFLAAVTDDVAGLERTYSFLRRRSVSHLFGSSAVFIAVVNACVIGMFGGGCLALAGMPVPLAVVIAVALGVAVIAASFAYGMWTYRTAWRNHRPLRRAEDPAQGAFPRTRPSD
ncbi:hypothetical protein [Microbacterium sp. BK668]|uniref:hypothetical protein n=1 Tax=Microbacterium sp. BK668 TaxID=2512118 RepID=UPI0010CE145F|nr:hypothetical protein [Microbacterium sp. BK668]TDN92998.1 hypothetical protein EV279_2540 [Microbacterium sp. BK668]